MGLVGWSAGWAFPQVRPRLQFHFLALCDQTRAVQSRLLRLRTPQVRTQQSSATPRTYGENQTPRGALRATSAKREEDCCGKTIVSAVRNAVLHLWTRKRSEDEAPTPIAKVHAGSAAAQHDPPRSFFRQTFAEGELPRLRQITDFELCKLRQQPYGVDSVDSAESASTDSASAESGSAQPQIETCALSWFPVCQANDDRPAAPTPAAVRCRFSVAARA